MVYVSIPNDSSKVKTKVAFDLIKRQLLCFGAMAVAGIPSYLFTRTAIGNTGAMLLMITFMLPCFLIAIYERDGQLLEKAMHNIVRSKFLWSRTHPYQTQDFYSYLGNPGKEVSPNGIKNRTPTRPRKKWGA